jgi:hypothetical protein
MTGTTLAAIAVLAEQKGPTGEASKSGPWGLAIILLLCLACYFLFKSMSRHMRKVREQFPTDRGRAGGPGGPGRPGGQHPQTPSAAAPAHPVQNPADPAGEEPPGDAADPGSRDADP